VGVSLAVASDQLFENSRIKSFYHYKAASQHKKTLLLSAQPKEQAIIISGPVL
jgi:hypothetical protein